MQCAVSLTPNMSRDVALRSGEDDMTSADDDMTNADDELADSDYDSRRDHSHAAASASADTTDSGSGSGSDDQEASLCDGNAGNDSGPDHIPDPHSSHSPHHGHHHSREPHTASGNGHAMNHSIDHGSDSGSECDMYRDPDLATWFGKPQGERSHGPSDTMPQAEYALGSDFASASEPLEACQERDEKVRNLKASMCNMT